MYYFSILYSFPPFIFQGGHNLVMFHLMKIGPWVARKRKAFWEARFAVAVANCNAGMISRSQHITD
jgi:hypothetical protein